MRFVKKFFQNKFFKWSFIIFLFIIMTAWLSNTWIVRSTKSQLYDDINKIPFRNVAMVLGTSAKARNGYDNLFFNYRMEAAAQLFKAGKVKHILVSGDNHIEGYDEPTEMKLSLVKLGVPDSCITMDCAGFRTLDSVVRTKEVFGQTSFTIVSQEFHNERAVFLANKYWNACLPAGRDVVAFNAKDVPAKYSIITSIREYFAKYKAVLDIYILHTEPKFLGDPIKIKY